MPEKLGNGGNSLEEYSSETGKYISDGKPNKYYDNPKEKKIKSLNNKGEQLSLEQQEFFKDSKVRDENGNLMVMYHGTPNGGYDYFKPGTYFTNNKEYAKNYTNPNASSTSNKFGLSNNNPKVFQVYLNMKKPFDINDPDVRKIYINEYIKGGWATGIDPYADDSWYDKNINSIDWTEGENLMEFLEENGYDYDGLVLDEGGVPAVDEKGRIIPGEFTSRGKSYVILNPNAVKSIDNLNPQDDKYFDSEEKRAANLFGLKGD